MPPAGATVRNLTSIEVDFSEGVAGVDASDLLISGGPATSVTAFAPWQYVFQFPQPALDKVQLAWAADHGIHDLAGSPNNFAGGSWTYKLDANAPLPGVVISEFMADNKKTIHDEDGDSSDWIELFNPTASDVNLVDWALTADPKNLMEWRFPNITLAANSYLLLFASGKDRTNVTGRLHTNFQLSPGGEFLALVDPTTNIVSSFTPVYPPQQTDVSYGRDRVSPDVAGYFTVPTPGAPNSTIGAGFSPKVEFSRNGGTFTSPFPLELWTSSTNAEIRFTLDGSAPTDASSLYGGPVSLTNTVQIRTRAFAPGLLPGALHSESYILLNANVINFTSNLPVIVIHNFAGGGIPVSTDGFANMSFYEPQSGKTSLTNAPTLSTRAGIHVRGSSTQGLPKQSWAVEFRDDFNDPKSASPLGLPADSDWVLYAPNNFEPVLIHNPFIYQLSDEIGRYAPRTRLVEVYLNTAGGAVSSANYNGIYVLEEKIKQGKHRVDIDKLQPENVNPPEVTGGYMMKIDRLGPGESGFFAVGQLIDYVDPKEPEITLPQRAPQQQYPAKLRFSGCRMANGGEPGCSVFAEWPGLRDTRPGSLDHSRKGCSCKSYTRSPGPFNSTPKRSPTPIVIGPTTVRSARRISPSPLTASTAAPSRMWPSPAPSAFAGTCATAASAPFLCCRNLLCPIFVSVPAQGVHREQPSCSCD